MLHPILLDCTLRDGGYYNAWDFSTELVDKYLIAMAFARVDVVELGFRFLGNNGFKGACAYTSDYFLRSLNIPENLMVSVMINASDLLVEAGVEMAIDKLFPETAKTSPVELVRIAVHFHEIDEILPAVTALNDKGFKVGINLMQITDKTKEEIAKTAQQVSKYPIEVLYFADSMGSLTPEQTKEIIDCLRKEWKGSLGIHTHDNMGLALQNTVRAYNDGVHWLDGTITGMGRGAGNARIEEILIEFDRNANLLYLMKLIRTEFNPMKYHYGWGSNPYYFLAGKYGIHPTYIQTILKDARYNEEDIFTIIKYLGNECGRKFNNRTLEAARSFSLDEGNNGTWNPASLINSRDVLILATGEGVKRHRTAIETYIREKKPFVMALNTQASIDTEFIDVRVVCHPVRLLADYEIHLKYPQPLITPVSMLPENLKDIFASKIILDFGVKVEADKFEFFETKCTIPMPLVMAYALAIVVSGKAKRILMAGFDGYTPGDPRNLEVSQILETFMQYSKYELFSVTPTTHNLRSISIYGPI